MNVISSSEYYWFQLFGSIDRTISVVQNESKIDIYSFPIADANNMRNISQEMLYCCCSYREGEYWRNKTPVFFFVVDVFNVHPAWPKIRIIDTATLIKACIVSLRISYRISHEHLPHVPWARNKRPASYRTYYWHSNAHGSVGCIITWQGRAKIYIPFRITDTNNMSNISQEMLYYCWYCWLQEGGNKSDRMPYHTVFASGYCC